MSTVSVAVAIHQGNMPKKGKVADMFEAFGSRHTWVDALGGSRVLGNKDTIQVRRHQSGYSFLLNAMTPVWLNDEFAIAETEPPHSAGTLVMEWTRHETAKGDKLADVANQLGGGRPRTIDEILPVSAERKSMAGQPKPMTDTSSDQDTQSSGFGTGGALMASWFGETHEAKLHWHSSNDVERANSVYPDGLFNKVLNTLVKYLDKASVELPVMIELDGDTQRIDDNRVMAIVDLGGIGYLVRIDQVDDSVFVVDDGQATLPSGTIKFVIESITEHAKETPTSYKTELNHSSYTCKVEVHGEQVSNRLLDSIVSGFVNDPFVALADVERLDIGYSGDQDVAFIGASDGACQPVGSDFIYINEGGVFVKLEPVRPGSLVPLPTKITVTELTFHRRLLDGNRGGYAPRHRSPSFGRGRSTVRDTEVNHKPVPTREWIPQLNQAVYLEDDPKQEMYYISDFDQYEKKFIITMADSLRAQRKRDQAVEGAGGSQVAVEPGRLRPFVLFY